MQVTSSFSFGFTQPIRLYGAREVAFPRLHFPCGLEGFLAAWVALLLTAYIPVTSLDTAPANGTTGGAAPGLVQMMHNASLASARALYVGWTAAASNAPGMGAAQVPLVPPRLAP